jgi:hypothetical protein
VRNWREWFVTPEEASEPLHALEDQVRDTAGSGHRCEDRPFGIKKEPIPRCAKCKEPVDHGTGLHLMLTGQWRIHVSCFAEVLERHFEDGEVIDITTGCIRKVEGYEPFED